MKRNNKTGDTTEVSHIISAVRESLYKVKEVLYKVSVICDEKTEGFRQAVSEITDLKKNAETVKEKVYEYAVAVDDALENFRVTVAEMVTIVTLVGELTGQRVHQAIGRAGKKKTYGVVAVDRKFEHKVEKVWETLRESQFGETIEELREKRRRRIHRMDAFVVRKQKLSKKIEYRIDSLIERFLENRKRYTVAMASAVGCMMLFCLTVNAGTVYNYYYHGTEMGTVKDKTQVEEAVSQVKENVTEEMDVDVSVIAEPDVDITYEKQFSFSAVVDTADAVADKLVNSGELEAEGFAIQVDGQIMALVDKKETAEQILDTIKTNYCTIDPETEATALEAVQAVSDNFEADTSATSPVDAAVARNIILAGSVNSETGVVAEVAAEAGDGVIDAVPKEEEIKTVDYSNIDFTVIDPTVLEGISIDNVSFEEEVRIEPVTAKVSSFSDYDDAVELFVAEDGTSKVLTVKTSEIEVYEESISFETVYEDTDELYEGETKVKSEGADGEKQIVANVTRDNGEELSREIISETILTEPVDEVVLRGTKEKPSWVATGVLIRPATGRFSSGFGSRWGRSHNGIDIAGSTGSNIVAADGGTVVFAGYNSSGYGNMVKIDHGNGMQTWYAHNSSLNVSVGDKVYQGQVIARMGNTGRSTGTHCHFEVRINGTPVNPLNYVSY